MNIRFTLPLAISTVLLGSCQHLDSVLFVTDSSLGINIDNKPPTLSLAYDRTEGYFAPRYSTGDLPAAVASIGIGGSFFDPAVRQVYATGDAAIMATDATVNTAPHDKKPNGTTDQERPVFFGTSTTIGAKIGWGADSPVGVDSFHFGFQRKEFSYLPLRPLPQTLAHPTNGPQNQQEANDVYPSVLASIDSVTDTSQQNGGLTLQQFFSTGTAAENLAKTSPVRKNFVTAAGLATRTALPPPDAKMVQDMVNTTTSQDAKIDPCVAPGGMFKAQQLTALIAAAEKPPSTWRASDALKGSKSLDDVHTYLLFDDTGRATLASAAQTCPQT